MDLNSAKQLVGSFPPWLLLGVGFVSGWLKSCWNFVYSHTVGLLVNKIKVELTIEEKDHREAFLWINFWTEKHLNKKKITNLRLQRKQNGDDNLFDLLPSYGFYWFFWDRKILTFFSEKKEAGGGQDGFRSNPSLIRTISMTIWGTRDRKKLLEVIEEAKEEYLKTVDQTLQYYTHDNYGDWNSSNMSDRPLDTVYLPENQINDIIGDIDLFYESKQKYKMLGIPWRRGYCFEGPPGTGKTTVIQALACKYKLPIYYVSLQNITGKAAKNLMSSVECPCFVLMEDIDSVGAAIDRSSAAPETSEAALKPTDLLNILDGLIASEQRIVIITTNHPEKIDPAIMRPGRIDRRFHLDYSKEEEIKKFYSRAAEYYSLPSYEEFRSGLNENCTIAEAQGRVFKIQNESLTSKRNSSSIKE